MPKTEIQVPKFSGRAVIGFNSSRTVAVYRNLTGKTLGSGGEGYSVLGTATNVSPGVHSFPLSTDLTNILAGISITAGDNDGTLPPGWSARVATQWGPNGVGTIIFRTYNGATPADLPAGSAEARFLLLYP